MQKAYVCVQDVDIDNGRVRILFKVAIDGARMDDQENPFSWDYTVDSTKAQIESNAVFKERIALELNARGYKEISTGDVITLGLPVILDPQSYADKSKGVTSDRTAVALEPAKEDVAIQPLLSMEQPGRIARMVNAVKEWWG